MATFKARIEDKIGDIPLLGGDSDDSHQAITDALTDSASEILDIISEEYLWASVAVTSDATSNPITSADQENIKILDVSRKNSDDIHGEYVSCKYVSPLLLSQVQNPESIHYPSKESPVWTWKDRRINVFPAPAANNQAKSVHVYYPSSISYGATAVTNFPNELEHVLVLGACVKLKQRQVSFYNEDEDGELSQMHQSQYADIVQLYSNAIKPFLAVPPAEE